MSEFNNGDVTDVLDSFFIDYAIDEDDDEANVQELMQQRSDMSEAVNEWYAKAKAFDEISDYWRTKDMLKLGHFVDKAIRKYAGEYESGESDAKK